MRRYFSAVVVLTALLGSLTLFPPRAAAAQVWNEVGDAGALPTVAQGTSGVGVLSLITGILGSTTDVDMFLLDLTGGGTFSATTVDQEGLLFDSQLYLFSASGLGVYANDDDLFSLAPRSTLPAFNPLTPVAPGFYYLAISGAPRRPISGDGSTLPAFNLIFPAEPYTDVAGPVGPGGGSAITNWTNTAFEGTGAGVTYTIALTGAQYAVPEPGTLVLLVLGASAPLACVRLRRRTG